MSFPDADELRTLLEDGGLLGDGGGRTLLLLSGDDRLRYLNGQITNDLATLDPGLCLPAFLTNAKGRLEAAVSVVEMPGRDAYLIQAESALAETLGPRLEKYIIADDCRLEDIGAEFALLHFFGKATLDLGKNDLGDDIIAFANLRRLGLPGIDLLVPRASLATFLAGLGTPPLTGEAAELLRLSLGVPAWGLELTGELLAPEAGPAFAESRICYTKGCYVGQEVISRINSVGRVNRTIVSLSADGDNDHLEPGFELLPATGDAISPKAVGHLTSAIHSPLLGRDIALALVQRDHAAPGTPLLAGPGRLPLIVREPPLA
ncbi:MAG: folate-binding protein YgfZ [Verrucomicrobiales bacterium]